MKKRPKKTLGAQMLSTTNHTLEREKKKKAEAEEEKERLDSVAKQEAPEVGQEIYEKCLDEMRRAAASKEHSVSVRTMECSTQFDERETPSHKRADACIRRFTHAADHAITLLTKDGSIEAKWDIETSEFVPSGSDPMFPYRFTTFYIQVHIKW